MLGWLSTFADQVRAFSDADLLAAYRLTDREHGSPEADALLTEIQRRELDM